MRIIAIIQARMSSTRLPGKVLMDLSGETVLGRVVGRLRRAKLIDRIVVATSVSPLDEPIIAESKRLEVASFRGSEFDVLDRYYRAGCAFAAHNVVRITSDCPLIDPELVDETIGKLRDQTADYASNATQQTYPRGLDVEVFTMTALKSAWQNSRQPYEREHVTPYFYEHPEVFRLVSLVGTTDYSQYRWTLDTPEDLQLLRAVYDRLGNQDDFNWQDVIALMGREPQLADLNCKVRQKSLQ
jgi:spore coat polysaccharide biosynthesis protein SpsF